jgi:hypothetical protein
MIKILSGWLPLAVALFALAAIVGLAYAVY